MSGKISCCRPLELIGKRPPSIPSLCSQGKKFELPKFEGFKAPQIKLPEVKAPQVRSTQ